jgi:hypothetical protein
MNAKAAPSKEERRKAKRTAIQEGFNLFLVIPKIFGMTRIYLSDLSPLGIKFKADHNIQLKDQQSVQVHLYLNAAIYLPLECKIIRATDKEVALQFLNPQSTPCVAIGKLQEFLEAAEGAGIWAD